LRALDGERAAARRREGGRRHALLDRLLAADGLELALLGEEPVAVGLRRRRPELDRYAGVVALDAVRFPGPYRVFGADGTP
jgi:hypothetical protein